MFLVFLFVLGVDYRCALSLSLKFSVELSPMSFEDIFSLSDFHPHIFIVRENPIKKYEFVGFEQKMEPFLLFILFLNS